MPDPVWTVLGAAVTAAGFIIVRLLHNSNAQRHDRQERTSAPYGDLAERLEKVEERASAVPMLEAHLWAFHLWSEEIIAWAEKVRQLVNGRLGDPLPPMPPSPKIDRRILQDGPPYGWDRRDRYDPT